MKPMNHTDPMFKCPFRRFNIIALGLGLGLGLG
jgi:hypothetical protein